jgi:hypothetical protein
MALRLQMKLGVVAEEDRLPDSPDTVVVVEPSVGARARTKGQLYVLVTSAISTQRAAEATRLAAETIQNAYYYDESAGIRVCIEKAVSAANKRLTHMRERNGLVTDVPGSGPIGVGVAVVRGNELYVSTVGPAEAYLIRGAQLSTLPDPNRERGLPTTDPLPDVWRGELSMGDSLVLISPNMMARLGADELKDAMVTLHPQSAMEHLHHRFILADGRGSDGALALEATEVPATQQSRSPAGVRPPEPLAGLPNRSPIPLADSVTDGVAAVQAGARQAGAAAGGMLASLLRQAQDLMPRRRTPYRRVTPLSARRDLQRRAAIAVLVFVTVVGGLGMGYWIISGSGASGRVISSANAGQAALDRARSNLERVFGATASSGINLVVDDPSRALQLLTDAHAQLGAAVKAGIPTAVTQPLQMRVVAGLDTLYKLSEVHESVLFQMPSTEPPIDLRALVRGPDGAPYVLDAATKAVYRLDLPGKAATVVLRAGQKLAGGADAAEPKLLSVGGPDLLVLDAANTLWRWRPADAKGKGTLARVRVNGSASWGQDISGMGTYVRNANAGLYNLYIVDPSAQQILAYAPAADGSGFPAAPSGRLATARAIDTMRSLYIDGDIFAIEHGRIERFVSGRTDGWDAANPGDELLRPVPVYGMIASGSDRRTGRLYAWDPGNLRIVALDKVDGRFRAQYRLPPGYTYWSDIRGMYILPGVADQPDTLIWAHQNAVFDTVLEAAVALASPSPGAAGASPAAPASSGTPLPAP